jgi:hypothetical protein
MMADITMCLGDKCHQKESCYRYMAKTNLYRQSFFTKPPLQVDGNCPEFIEVQAWVKNVLKKASEK